MPFNPFDEESSDDPSASDGDPTKSTRGIYLPPSSDPNGNSAPISCRLPPQYFAAIEKILREDDSPFETTSDFVRSAIHAQVIAYANSIDPTSSALVSLLKSWERTVFRNEVYSRLLDTLNEAAIALSEYVNFGDEGRIKKEVEEVLSGVLALEDAFWQRKLLEQILSDDVFVEALSLLEEKGVRSDAIDKAEKLWDSF
jgi:hypothetical protein